MNVLSWKRSFLPPNLLSYEGQTVRVFFRRRRGAARPAAEPIDPMMRSMRSMRHMAMVENGVAWF